MGVGGRALNVRGSIGVHELVKGSTGFAEEDASTATESDFEEFFRAEQARLLRAMYLVTGVVEEAEEACQEAFARVWERWNRVQTLQDPVGYLYRTALNWHRSRLRRARRAVLRAVLPSQVRDPFAEADAHDEVIQALQALTPRQRTALVLTELFGYPSEDAGRLMGIRAVTVRVLASQGRAALRSNPEETDA